MFMSTLIVISNELAHEDLLLRMLAAHGSARHDQRMPNSLCQPRKSRYISPMCMIVLCKSLGDRPGGAPLPCRRSTSSPAARRPPQSGLGGAGTAASQFDYKRVVYGTVAEAYMPNIIHHTTSPRPQHASATRLPHAPRCKAVPAEGHS